MRKYSSLEEKVHFKHCKVKSALNSLYSGLSLVKPPTVRSRFLSTCPEGVSRFRTNLEVGCRRQYEYFLLYLLPNECTCGAALVLTIDKLTDFRAVANETGAFFFLINGNF